MRKFTAHYSFIILLIISYSCNPVYRASSVQYKDYPVQSERKDASVQNFLQPYADSVNNSMNLVIGQLAVDLDKRQPESTLGNFMADAMKAMAEKYYKTTIDGAFINYGGIRLNGIKAGAITRGKIFELMPFDNVIILQKLKGTVLQEFLDHVIGRGGWPVAGITMQMKDKKAVNVMIGGKPIDPNMIYTIANSDYVANGGDNCVMLKVIPQINNGSLLRDGLIEYVQSFTQKGQPITATIQNRVTNAQ
ncbi:5'-nucleotidase C-terminal domain-containing protein [Lacibacter sp.]|uniref:5'-nucleotidase C-terminal domain-containing protein n=1 Tax=Lacibacter sp. TaxID=1915409 RepID=UPI002B4B328F|nr:5'-nucleotidase C-terminal domain-containing protein [Lacibacter sp.]HLP38268.1 5'-nucleotidase C-terminal domain-containing protein [Lacibacter sp.]